MRSKYHLWLICNVIDSSLFEAVVNDCRHHGSLKIIILFNPLFYVCHELVVNLLAPELFFLILAHLYIKCE